MGVDVIIGSHPHVVQPAELLTSTDGAQQTLCLYSLGNFLSNQRADNIALTTGHSEDGLMCSFSFIKYNNGQVFLDNVQLIPTWVLIRGSGDNKTYQVIPLDESIQNWKEAYNLSSDQLNSANKSLERTKAVVDTGLKAIQETLSQQKADRGETLGTFVGGVG